jgi:hypothetical protein
MSEQEKEKVRQKLQETIMENEEQTKDKEEQIQTIENQMVEVKKSTQNMIENFRKSHFFLSVA